MIALLYHDVVAPGGEASSGFPGGDADRYKFDRDTFARHLDAIAARGSSACFTFDDGGVSAAENTAGLLEQHGWHGMFFITTDFIGKPGFLDPDQIRELQSRGHQIGSHSCSHPARMSHCGLEQLIGEWKRSCDALAEITGGKIENASVPGGYYSRRVAQAAAAAGIKRLFTSEPVTSVAIVEECGVFGRYSIQRGTSPETAAAIAAGERGPRWRQYAFWSAKKAIKSVGGERWLQFRRQWLRRAGP